MNERVIKLLPGYMMIPVLLAMCPVGVIVCVSNAVKQHLFYPWGLTAIVLGVAWLIMLAGFKVVNPNEARVLQLFGRYVGTLKEPGLYFGNPFYVSEKISLRLQTFETGQTKTPEKKDAQGNTTEASHTSRRPSKVNDKDGTPIEIAAVVLWRVVNTAEAVFLVDNVEDFVHMQSEAALRGLASQYSYDAVDGQFALRGHIDEICNRLKLEVQERVRTAGVVIEDSRISYLAYAPEIASAMLQRQQAGAVIAARAQIVEGAVGMVEHALEMLNSKNIVELDAERKAAMVSNLLIVLCGHSVPQPVVNAGTIYH